MRWGRQGGEIVLGFGHALGDGLIEPGPRLGQVAVTAYPFCEIAGEHQLGLAMAELGR